MELSTEAEYYTAIINEEGNYIDKIPPSHIVSKGLRCLCGSRKDKIFTSYTSFSCHVQTKRHQVWLKELNTNKQNYYRENEEMKNIIHTQKIIIAKMEKELISKNNTIDQLTQHLLIVKETPNYQEVNLLEFDE
jgi:hypothetical protein